MFNFTTETVLNDLTKVKYLVGAQSLPTYSYDWDPGIETGKKVLFIEHLNKFIVAGTYDKIVDSKVYKRVASAATQATRYVTIPATTTGVIYKLGVHIISNNSPDGQFARDRTTYGKPFYIEYVATDTSGTTAATALKTAWNAAFATYSNFPIATTNGAQFILTAVNNPYLWFKEFTWESFSVTTDSIGIVTPITVTMSAGTPGAPAFGDYTDVVKNHRLPTMDSYRPFGLNQEELPIVGATYNQYTFEYSADRGTMDQSVVGGEATSKTTHILWVNAAAASVVRHINGANIAYTGTYSFDQILETIGLTVTDAVTGADLSSTIDAVVEA